MARSKKKLIGKSTWYKEKKEEMIIELEDLDKNIKKTKQEKRKDERFTKKEKVREKKIKGKQARDHKCHVCRTDTLW